MLGLVIVVVVTAFVLYVLHGFAKQVDEIEEDSAHLYDRRGRAAYGSKFLNILIGRDRH